MRAAQRCSRQLASWQERQASHTASGWPACRHGPFPAAASVHHAPASSAPFIWQKSSAAGKPQLAPYSRQRSRGRPPTRRSSPLNRRVALPGGEHSQGGEGGGEHDQRGTLAAQLVGLACPMPSRQATEQMLPAPAPARSLTRQGGAHGGRPAADARHQRQRGVRGLRSSASRNGQGCEVDHAAAEGWQPTAAARSSAPSPAQSSAQRTVNVRDLPALSTSVALVGAASQNGRSLE